MFNRYIFKRPQEQHRARYIQTRRKHCYFSKLGICTGRVHRGTGSMISSGLYFGEPINLQIRSKLESRPLFSTQFREQAQNTARPAVERNQKEEIQVKKYVFRYFCFIERWFIPLLIRYFCQNFHSVALKQRFSAVTPTISL